MAASRIGGRPFAQFNTPDSIHSFQQGLPQLGPVRLRFYIN
jgi:hypothetical protein